MVCHGMKCFTLLAEMFLAPPATRIETQWEIAEKLSHPLQIGVRQHDGRVVMLE